jgi:hypothetical protein
MVQTHVKEAFVQTLFFKIGSFEDKSVFNKQIFLMDVIDGRYENLHFRKLYFKFSLKKPKEPIFYEHAA